MIFYLIALLLFVLIIHQIIYWVYFVQLKEYRLDRFLDAFRLRSDCLRVIAQGFNIAIWFRPKATARALLSIVLASLLGILLFLGFSVFGRLFLAFFAPFLAFACLVFFTPLFNSVKKMTIRKAQIRMKTFKGVVIGVTGSYGKSSTKELLYQVLKTKFKVAKTPGNTNSEIGVAQSLLSLKGDEEVFIVEMGAYKMGEIKAICNIVRPKIGVITGLGDQHLSLFGSLENLRRAKYELVESLPKDGLALVADKDFKIEDAVNIQVTREKVDFDYNNQHFSLPLLGRSSVRNAMSVIKVATYLGLSLGDVAASLSGIDKNLFYPKLIQLKPGVFLIDDSYNLSFESFLSIIDYLSVWNDYKKVLITPGMIELGDNARKDHAIVAEKLGIFDSVFLTNPSFYNVLNKFKNVKLETNFKSLIKILSALYIPKTLFVFKGRVPKSVIESLIRHD